MQARIIVLAAGVMVGRLLVARAGESGDSKARQAALACEPKLETAEIDGATESSIERPTPVKVKVAGRVFVLEKENGERTESLKIYPADAGSVFVAIVYAGSAQREPRGSDSLWRVPCAAGGNATIVAHAAGADFGHSALIRDGRKLFYTGADGIFVLDLGTQKSRRVTKAAFAVCTQEQFDAIDVVRELSPNGALLFDRGCYYEWDWHGQGMRLRHPESRKPVVERAPRPSLPAVSVDAGGGIWLSDGWCEDRSTYQRLLHSADLGGHWNVVRVEPVGDQIIREIIADAKNSKALLVFTGSCLSSSTPHTEPGWIYVTEDRGATFRAIGIPPGISDELGHGPLYEADPLYAIVAQQGLLANLILYGDSSDRTSDTIGRWTSHDLGRTWKKLPPEKMSIEALPKSSSDAAFGDWTVSIQPDGLYLSTQAGKPSRSLIYRRH